MLTVTNPVNALYRDDSDPAVMYALPSGLAPAVRPDGTREFSLLFYQADQPERGARLVTTLAPDYPPLGDGVRRADLVLLGSSVRLSWPGAAAQSAVVDPTGRVELSLSRSEASLLHQSLRAGVDDVRVVMRAAYEVCRAPVAAVLHVDLRQAADALRERSESFTGASLRQALEDLAPTLLRATSSPLETAAIAAPYLAARLCTADDATPIFADQQLRLRAPEDIIAGELSLDLLQVRSWQELCELSWSLAEFYRSVAGTPSARAYFPEVLSLPPVGTVQLLVENLLPIDGHVIDRVSAQVRYRRLGSLEEQVWSGEFRANSAPVLGCAIPRIAMTDFSYRYQARVHVLDGIYPEEPVWIERREPILRIDGSGLPFVFGYVAAHSQVFAHVARIELEIAPSDPNASERAHATLMAATSWSWLALDARAFAIGRLRWRALCYRDLNEGPAVELPWREGQNLGATVTLADVYPRTPVRVQALATYAELPLVQGVVLELASGETTEPPLTAASSQHTLASDQETALTVWPRSIFERGVSYRYAIDTSGRDREWTAWRYSTEQRLDMTVVDDFYSTRTIHLSVRGPWSQRGGPDASQRAPELIFAEIHLRSLGSDPVLETTYTFDRNTSSHDWVLRCRQRDRRISYDVVALTLDGRMLQLGTFDLTGDSLALELYVTKVSDSEPPEFGVR